MSNHAISDPVFRLKVQGFRDGAARRSQEPSLECDEHYNAGYRAGQEAARKYSLQICTELGLVNPVIKLKET